MKKKTRNRHSQTQEQKWSTFTCTGNSILKITKLLKNTTVRTFKATHRIRNTLSPTPETRPSSGDLVRPRNIGVSVTQSAQALSEMYLHLTFCASNLIFSLNFVTLDGLLFQ
jgi:hypothetical protein